MAGVEVTPTDLKHWMNAQEVVVSVQYQCVMHSESMNSIQVYRSYPANTNFFMCLIPVTCAYNSTFIYTCTRTRGY